MQQKCNLWCVHGTLSTDPLPPTSSSRAEPPLVPYLGIALNELVGIFEALPTHIEGNLINFSKMRKVGAVRMNGCGNFELLPIPNLLLQCSRTISGLLQYQNERYEFTTNEEVSTHLKSIFRGCVCVCVL